jgi:hypothetical protein
MLFDRFHPAFHRLRCGAERLAILGPIASKLIGAVNERIRHNAQNTYGKQHDDQ